MDPITFRQVLRDYATGIESGAFDTDITSARERHMTALAVRTVSNDDRAARPYSEVTPGIREDLLRSFRDTQWIASVMFFVRAASPSAEEPFGAAIVRTFTIVRSI